MMTGRRATHWCNRCKENCLLDEWSYDPETNRWTHIRELTGAVGAQGTPVDLVCGWSEKVPVKQ